LREGSPAEAIDELQGRIWKKILTSDAELSEMEKSMPVISTHLVAGLTEVRVYSETQPGPDFRPIDSSLEDVYFRNLSLSKN
jgi:ABC-2 type transport system ATP-binding protein